MEGLAFSSAIETYRESGALPYEHLHPIRF